MTNRPSVLFLYLDEKIPSSRIRVIDLQQLIVDRGIECTLKKFPRSILSKVNLLAELGNFDVIFVQKKMLGYIESSLLSFFSHKLVFDFDDAIYHRNSETNYVSYQRKRKFRSIVRRANLVIAGNYVLKKKAMEYNDNVIVLPSPVPVLDVERRDYKVPSDVFVIGWVGGKQNLNQITLITKELQRLSKEFDIKVHVISDGELDITGVNVVNIPWSKNVQRTEIAKFDVGIMPLFDNPWTQGKCGYKALQYMASAIPAICSDVGGNADLIDQGIDGFKAEEPSDFYKYIKQLISDESLRKRIGNNGREKVKHCCSNEVIANRVSSLIFGLYEE